MKLLTRGLNETMSTAAFMWSLLAIGVVGRVWG